MNQSNYVSQPVAQKLVGAGIVLETDFVWLLGADGWKLLNKDWVTNMMSNTYESYPAPCFAEIWRELPDEIELEDDGGSIALSVFKSGKTTYAGYYLNKDEEVYEEKESSNPADALAELLIWAKGQEVV
jgi:hypothetical protein